MISIKNIQKIKTNDGYMIPIYRNWDVEINEGHEPKMIYATTLEPEVEKDIILHERRTAYLTCIQGHVMLEALINGSLQNFDLNFENQDSFTNMLLISPNIPIKLFNKSKETSIIINCPSPSWHPEDQDTIKFQNWDEFKKWKID